jgi:hypothetical protein
MKPLMSRVKSLMLAAILGCIVAWAGLLMPWQPAWAGPVEWHEVAATSEGRQWWDSGSLRTNKSGNLTLLSRYQSTPPSTVQPTTQSIAQSTAQPTNQSTAQPISQSIHQSKEPGESIERSNSDQNPANKQLNKTQDQTINQSARARTDLYVMEIDCGQHIYRDTSINGIPQFNATWLPSGGDQLIDAVLSEACSASGAEVASQGDRSQGTSSQMSLDQLASGG